MTLYFTFLADLPHCWAKQYPEQPELGAGGSSHSANAPHVTAWTGVEETQGSPKPTSSSKHTVPTAGGWPTGGGSEPSAGVAYRSSAALQNLRATRTASPGATVVPARRRSR